jgi:hypothetical protein
MKRIFFNNRIIAIAFFTVFTALTTASVQAATIPPTAPIELKYLGTQENRPLFQLQVNTGAIDEVYTIIIRDGNNNSLYRERIIGGNFTKTFLFDRNEIGEEDIHFDVWCEKSREKISYVINYETRTVVDTQITKLK